MLLLTEIAGIIPVTKEIKTAIQKQFVKRDCIKSECLHEAGKVAKDLYFIEKGLVRMFYHNDAGKDITYGYYTEGDFITVPDSFFTQTPSKYHMEMMEEGILYAITFSDFNQMLIDHPVMQRLENKTLRAFLLKAGERIAALQFQSAQERYDTLMENQPSIIRRASLGTIASYLGITQETLSRIRARK
ncbi:MAG: Crp/Fnr family transcriptional regulator [Pedobacter sp.]|uniref:Crp/Fnr family transcriptional regulator n=1 Tax=Pedobacter sp. TaxID=1411316 RepID=UPI003566B7E9